MHMMCKSLIFTTFSTYTTQINEYIIESVSTYIELSQSSNEH